MDGLKMSPVQASLARYYLLPNFSQQLFPKEQWACLKEVKSCRNRVTPTESGSDTLPTYSLWYPIDDQNNPT